MNTISKKQILIVVGVALVIGAIFFGYQYKKQRDTMNTETNVSSPYPTRNDIGLKYFQQPDPTCESGEGSVLGEADDYAISSALCGENYVMWLSKKIEGEYKARNLYIGDGVKSPRMMVIDQVVIRTLNKGESFSLVGLDCYQEGKQIELAVIYNWKGRNEINKKDGGILKGWVVNLKSERIEPVSDESLATVNCKFEYVE